MPDTTTSCVAAGTGTTGEILEPVADISCSLDVVPIEQADSAGHHRPAPQHR